MPEIGERLESGAVFAGYSIDRDAHGIRCPACGTGYAEEVEPTPDEIREFGCGRPYACCTAAFVCAACGVRLVGENEAPEME